MNQPPQYLLRWRGRQLGPFTRRKVEEQLDAFQIGLFHEILVQGEWITLEDFLGRSAAQRQSARDQDRRITAEEEARARDDLDLGRLRQPPPPTTLPIRPAVPAPAAPPLPGPPPPLPATGAPKKRLIYAGLGLFVGYCGAHNFYLGRPLIGFAQLILTATTLFIQYGILLTWIWAVGEVIFVKRGKDGVPLT